MENCTSFYFNCINDDVNLFSSNFKSDVYGSISIAGSIHTVTGVLGVIYGVGMAAFCYYRQIKKPQPFLLNEDEGKPATMRSRKINWCALLTAAAGVVQLIYGIYQLAVYAGITNTSLDFGAQQPNYMRI